jgi:EAL domain-containing protein (putative c-di-GMP-specific phosphodiesterase class I)
MAFLHHGPFLTYSPLVPQSIRGPVSPSQFIPVAEDCGLIVPIGKWVLREACEQAQAWLKAGLPQITIAVNISATEIRNQNFLEGVFDTLRETGLNPGSLELELTESVLIKRAGATESILKSLRARGRESWKRHHCDRRPQCPAALRQSDAN